MRRLVKSCVLMTRPFAAVTIRCPKEELRWTRRRDRRGLYNAQAWSEDALFNIELHAREIALHEKSLALHERSLTLHEKTLVLHETSLALYEKSLALQKMTWPSRTVWKRLTSQDSIFKGEIEFNFISITNSGNHLYRHGASGKHSPSHISYEDYKTICVTHNLLLWIKHTHACFLGSYLYRWKCSIWKRTNLRHHGLVHPLSIFTCTTIRTRYCPENIRWGTEGWKVPTLRNLTGVRLRRVQELQA